MCSQARGAGVSRSRVGSGSPLPTPTGCCLVSEPSVLFSRFSYLPDHSEHKDGHVSRLGFKPTLPPTPGGRRTISARGQVAAGSRPAAPERKKGSLQCPPCPDPCIVDVRPNCLLRGHLGPSEFSSGKDVWLCSWQDWSFPDWCLRRALSVRVWPWVSVMSACGPRNDHRFTFYGYNFCSIGNCFYK